MQDSIRCLRSWHPQADEPSVQAPCLGSWPQARQAIGGKELQTHMVSSRYPVHCGVHACSCLLCLLACKKVRAGLPCCLIILGAMFCPQCSGAAILVQVESQMRWMRCKMVEVSSRKNVKTRSASFCFVCKQATPGRTVEPIHDKAQCSHAEPFTLKARQSPKFLTDFEIGVHNDYSDYSILQ